MPSRIRDYCRRTLQPVPESEGELVRCIFESLALKSRVVVDALETLTGPASLIHIVGGGSQSTLLCQFTCNALSRPVLAGPVEATAAGNVMVQALAHGRVSGLDHIRSIIRASHPPTPYAPKQPAEWGEAYRAFQDLLTRTHP
jgi:sugar (pentulose or hexulose) kinase